MDHKLQATVINNHYIRLAIYLSNVYSTYISVRTGYPGNQVPTPTRYYPNPTQSDFLFLFVLQTNGLEARFSH